jgi:hypothetical protein
MVDPILAFEGTFEEFEIAFRDDTFFIDVGNPWAGDTESGFGYTCHVSLTAGKALQLRDWLSAHLATVEAKIEAR